MVMMDGIVNRFVVQYTIGRNKGVFMKLKYIIIFFVLSTTFSFSQNNEKVVWKYSGDVNKISFNNGKTWIKNENNSETVVLKRISESEKKSENNGKSWYYNDSDNTRIVFLDLLKRKKVSYNSGITWHIIEKSQNNSILIFPNPCQNSSITVSYHSVDNTARLVIKNNRGIIQFSKPLIVNAGMNTQTIDVSEFLNGTYSIEILGNKSREYGVLNIVR